VNQRGAELIGLHRPGHGLYLRHGRRSLWEGPHARIDRD
jgi:hypothetical protein